MSACEKNKMGDVVPAYFGEKMRPFEKRRANESSLASRRPRVRILGHLAPASPSLQLVSGVGTHNVRHIKVILPVTYMGLKSRDEIIADLEMW